MIPEPNLSADFLARRREALVVAAARVFLGSTAPIPEMPPCPGVYLPPPVQGETAKRLAELERHREANRKYARAQRKPKPEGWVPSSPALKPSIAPHATKSRAEGRFNLGDKISWRGMEGTVLAFVPSEINPLHLVPAKTPRTCIKGLLQPVGFPRYLVAVVSPTHLVRYHLPRAVDVEEAVNPLSLKGIS